MLADHEILEMLLYYSIPRVNTNELAYRLIGQFGSLSAVFSVNRHELIAVPGVGERSADLIGLAHNLPTLCSFPLRRMKRCPFRSCTPHRSWASISGSIFWCRMENTYVSCAVCWKAIPTPLYEKTSDRKNGQIKKESPPIFRSGVILLEKFVRSAYFTLLTASQMTFEKKTYPSSFRCSPSRNP